MRRGKRKGRYQSVSIGGGLRYRINTVRWADPEFPLWGCPPMEIGMHYYKRNIGDYSKKAGRLTMLQHGAYTLLLDSCYDRERFPTLEEALEWTWASSTEEIDAVKFVLSRFFRVNEEGRYVQERIQEEIETYHKNAETNKRIAIERETKRKQSGTKRDSNSTKREPTVDDSDTNLHLTINHKPRTKKNIVKDSRATALPEDFYPDETGVEYAADRGVDLKTQLEQFKNFHTAKGSTYKNWQAAWRTWVGNAVSFGKVKPKEEAPWARAI